MTKFISLLLLIILATVSYAQQRPNIGQDYHYLISKPNYKVILLGEWASADKAIWRRTLDAEGIFEYGFTLFDRAAYGRTPQGLSNSGVEMFERWFYQFSGTPHATKWAVLGMDNRLIASGTKALDVKEFSDLLDRNGIESPQRIIRAFLQKHPDHIDAISDYLREVRRRAISRLSTNATTESETEKDLNKETDLKTWGVMAAEIDRIFNGQWGGMALGFFRPDLLQPECFSPLLRVSFTRQISKVEVALQEQCDNEDLWDIWAWMARCLPDYKWERFLKIVDSLPSPKVCAWLVAEARSKSDWNTVIDLSNRAKLYFLVDREERHTWIPGGQQDSYASVNIIKDWPLKSAYIPRLEALLRLGRIEEAHNVFDELIRMEPDFSKNNVKLAAEVARLADMEDVAILWERGEQVNKLPHLGMYSVGSGFLVLGEDSDDYVKEFRERMKGQDREARIIPNKPSKDPRLEPMGWRDEDGHRWAFIDHTLLAIAEGREIPSADEMQRIISRLYPNYIEERRQKIRENQGDYNSMLRLAFNLIWRNTRAMASETYTIPLSDEEDDALWGETARLLNRVLTNAPHLLIDLPFVFKPPAGIERSQLLKALSTRYLKEIESNLRKKPSSDNLWFQWIFWSAVEDGSSDIAPLIEAIEPSPFAVPGTVPPYFVFDHYYNECWQKGAWHKVIELLKTPYERQKLRIDEARIKDPNYKITDTKFGESVVSPYIIALLNDGKSSEAIEVFEEWTERGGTFANPLKLIEAAKESVSERLARDWEDKINKKEN
ncbi:MAG: hypothetical protein FWG02_03740 [Holophagaceae bacterium]|nr:hypothetical protein [Holophagaceae bacterium]